MKLRNSQTGSILISMLLVFPFLIVMVLFYMSLATSSFRVATKDQAQTHSQFAADAGADRALQEITLDDTWVGTNVSDPNWSGVGIEVNLHNETAARTTYQVTVQDISASDKRVTSIGRTYKPATSTVAASEVKIIVDLRPVSSGNFSIVTGVGGLIMENSARVLGGDVFINGELHMKNTAQIGLAATPGNVYIANQLCPIPADATYPRLCNSGENNNPITIENSAHIYGNVQANHQISGSGMTSPGLTASSGVIPQSLPPHDRAAQKAAVAVTRTGSNASCSGSQAKTWAANTKITGDVELKNSCTILVEGDVWITGNLKISNTAKIIVADGLGSTKPSIMIDGPNGAEIENSGLLNLNVVETGFQIITYWSTAGCSPDCPNVTGTDLYNSRNISTIKLKNSAAGANSIFYAKWSRVEVENTGSIGALVGQTIYLKNSGTITFGTSVGTGTSYWVVDGYRRDF